MNELAAAADAVFNRPRPEVDDPIWGPRPPPPPPLRQECLRTDFNHDGTTDPDDFVFYFERPPSIEAHFKHDGEINPDLADLIGIFYLC